MVGQGNKAHLKDQLSPSRNRSRQFRNKMKNHMHLETARFLLQ